MSGLQKINIPSSVTKIDEFGLQFSNSGMTTGAVTVVFDPKTSLTYIGDEVFSYMTSLTIKYTGNESPSCHPNALIDGQSRIIYAPKSFKFCGLYDTVVIPVCSAKNYSPLFIKCISYSFISFLLAQS